jgi:hypothetical protein
MSVWCGVLLFKNQIAGGFIETVVIYFFTDGFQKIVYKHLILKTVWEKTINNWDFFCSKNTKYSKKIKTIF